MEFITENWGSLASIAGLSISVWGLWVVVVRAGKAKVAAEAAEAAVEDVRLAISNTLRLVDLRRSIALVERLKTIHRERKWELGVEQYQLLRETIGQIDALLPPTHAEFHETLRSAIPQITVIGNSVDTAIQNGTEPARSSRFNPILNEIQSDLEKLASSALFVDNETEGRNG